MSYPTDPDALEAAIDRLVADDLDADARRALLLQLDAQPDGWRRCALAFLEDQAWRSALCRPAATASPEVAPAPIILPVPPRRAMQPMIRHAATAALLFAFAALGFRVGVASADRPLVPRVVSVPPAQAASISASALDPEPGQPIGYVSVVDPADGEAPPRRLPVLEATASNERWLAEQPASIPDYVKAQWERRGYQVEESRRLVSLDLDNGRRVAIPVDEVALDYVGREPL